MAWYPLRGHILKKDLDNLRMIDIFTQSARFTSGLVDQDESQQLVNLMVD